jgi:rhodanese-related sulfurtransferase
MQEITPQELKAKLDNGEDVELIDVREDYEVNVSQLPGAKHIPLNSLLNNSDDVVEASEAGKPIVMYCKSGQRSGAAVGLMEQQGIGNIYNLKGGIKGWKANVDPQLEIYEG